jgi:hypothetical protein
VSRPWRFTLDVLQECFQFLTWEDVVEAARDVEPGTITSVGEEGDCVALEFNGINAAVSYLSVEGVTLRPYFPHRPAPAQSITEFFCNCCGARLGSRDEFLRRGLPRGEGFRLCHEIVRSGSLSALVPEESPDQPMLPGMEQWAAELAERRMVEWRIDRREAGAIS